MLTSWYQNQALMSRSDHFSQWALMAIKKMFVQYFEREIGKVFTKSLELQTIRCIYIIEQYKRKLLLLIMAPLSTIFQQTDGR